MFQGGQFNDSSGVGTTSPGVSLYHEGMDLVAVVSTGDDVWKLQVQMCNKIVFLCTLIICGISISRFPFYLPRSNTIS